MQDKILFVLYYFLNYDRSSKFCFSSKSFDRIGHCEKEKRDF